MQHLHFDTFAADKFHFVALLCHKNAKKGANSKRLEGGTRIQYPAVSIICILLLINFAAGKRRNAKREYETRTECLLYLFGFLGYRTLFEYGFEWNVPRFDRLPLHITHTQREHICIA